MENQENETGSQKNTAFSKTQTNLNKSSKRKNEAKFRTTGAIIKLPKLSSNNTQFAFIGNFYQTPQNSGPILTQTFYNSNSMYDPNNLKQELSQNKTEMNAKRIELQELKIKFNKLYEDNKINKNLLVKILDIDLEKEFTKDELIDKLEHCKPSEEEKRRLKKAHEIIK